MLSASLVMISAPNFTLTILIYQVVIGMLSASLGGSVHGAALLWLQVKVRISVRGRGRGRVRGRGRGRGRIRDRGGVGLGIGFRPRRVSWLSPPAGVCGPRCGARRARGGGGPRAGGDTGQI